MKCRISAQTGQSQLNAYQRDAAKQIADMVFQARQQIYTRRVLLAVCLALNDLYGYGDKRLMNVLNGIADIVKDYSDRSFTPSEGRKGVDGELTAETDPVCIAMQEEMLSRPGVHLQITGGEYHVR